MAIVNNDPKKLFADNLDRILKIRRMNAAELAAALSVGENTISTWRNQRRFPGADSIQQVADYFDLPVAWFFTDHINAPAEPESDSSLQINSNEMEPFLMPGDTAHFKMERTVPSGSLAVININGQLVIRRVHYSTDNVTFSCANPAYAPLVYPRHAAPSILGIVTKLERKL